MKSHLTRRNLLIGGAAVTAGGLAMANPAIAAAARQIAAKPSGEPIVIGHQCELTGWDASTGYWRNKTAEKVTEWLNANGGIAGHPLELVTVDTKSDVDTGVNQMRKLLLEHNVDIIIGSEMTSIALASNKLAQEHGTLYMSMSTASDTTGKKHAVPFQFRMTTNSRAESLGSTKSLVEKVGKRWTIFYVDYAWGHSERDWFTKGVEAAGGEVVNPVAVPLDAQDLFAYVGRIDRSVDGIYIPVLNALQAIQTFRNAGFQSEIVLAGLSFSLFDFRDLGDYGEGVWGIELSPVELADIGSEHMANLYGLLGVDENGIETETGKAVGASMVVGMSQTFGFLKSNLEASNWASRADTPRLIKLAESVPEYAHGPLFPIGDVGVRSEDHQAFMDMFIVRVIEGRLRKQARISRADTVYPAEVNLASR